VKERNQPQEAENSPKIFVNFLPLVADFFLCLPAFVFQNCIRATIVPCRGGGVGSIAAPAAAGLVLLPPTAAELMYPKPPLVKPVSLSVVWVASAFIAVGTFIPVRLKMFVNSARIIRLAFSLNRKVRVKL